MANTPSITSAKLKRRTVLAGHRCTIAMPSIIRAKARASSASACRPRPIIRPSSPRPRSARKLFEKEGIKAELTIYRSGAEGFEAIAAGAADLDHEFVRRASPAASRRASTSAASPTAAQRLLRLVPGGEGGFQDHEGRPNWPARRSASPRPARAPTSSRCGRSPSTRSKFTRVPLGGGGLVPNLLSGNIDATVLYSPLTYKVMRREGGAAAHRLSARRCRRIRRRAGSPPTRSSRRSPEVVQKAMNALYGGVGFLRRRCQPRGGDQAGRRDRRDSRQDRRRRTRRQHQELSRTGEFKMEWMERALEMAKLIGMKDLAPANEIYVDTVQAGSDQGLSRAVQ